MGGFSESAEGRFDVSEFVRAHAAADFAVDVDGDEIWLPWRDRSLTVAARRSRRGRARL